MTPLCVLALALLAGSSHAYYGGYGMGYGVGVMPSYGLGVGVNPMLGGVGLGHGHHKQPEPSVLTCRAMFTDAQGNVANTIAVTVEEQGGSSLDRFNSMMGLGVYGHPGFALGAGGLHGQRGLKATVELVSNVRGGKGFVVFTERARPTDGCKAENFGDVLARASKGGLGGVYGAGFGGVYGGFGMGMGMMHPGLLHGQQQERGVVAEISVTPGATTTAVIDNLEFDKLSDLAGRGVVVCSEVEFDFEMKAICKEPFYSCCSLAYDNKATTDDE